MTSKPALARLLSALAAAAPLTFVAGCASTTLTPGGAAVKVYETDRKHGQPDASLPSGCRMLSASKPFRQQATERVNVKDPYRADRNATADRGGNMLLVRSSRIVELKRTECPTTDRSPECQGTDQSWYDVTLESYACDAPAMATLAETPAQPSRVFWWPFESGTRASTAASPAPAAASPAVAASPAAATSSAPTSPAPAAPRAGLSTAELKAKLLALMQEGVGTDVLVAYVKSRAVAAPLTAEEIVDWKRAGIAEPVIEAAIAQGSVH
jgi:hypothetical protein